MDLLILRHGQPYLDWKTKALAGNAPKNVAIQSKFYVADQIVSEGDRRLSFTVSTGVVDRDKDIVKAEGFMFEDYRKNPVVLFGHDASKPPVAQAETINARDGRVKSRALFATREQYDFADTIFQLCTGKFLRAVSPGFTPVDFTVDKARGGVNFEKQALLEWSIVPIPSNPEALQEAKSMGIDLTPLKRWAEQTLDQMSDEPGLWLPKAMVEKALKVVDPKSSVSVSTPPSGGGDTDTGGHAGAGAGAGSKVVTVKGSTAFIGSMAPLIEKIGRVLSAKNEAALRAALTAIEDVLDQISSGDVEKPVTLNFTPALRKAIREAKAGAPPPPPPGAGAPPPPAPEEDAAAKLIEAITAIETGLGQIPAGAADAVVQTMVQALATVKQLLGIGEEQPPAEAAPGAEGGAPQQFAFDVDDLVTKASESNGIAIALGDGVTIESLTAMIADSVKRERMKLTGQLPD